MIEELFSRFLIVFTTLIVIVDPVGVVPSFISLTKNYSKADIDKIIIKSVSAGALVLLFFSLFGTYLFLAAFSIQLVASGATSLVSMYLSRS